MLFLIKILKKFLRKGDFCKNEKNIYCISLFLIVFLGISLPVSKAEPTTNLSYNLKEIQSLEINQDYTIEILKDTSEERVVEVTDKMVRNIKLLLIKKTLHLKPLKLINYLEKR